MNISERTFDIANRYRVVVIVSSEKAIALKFQEQVSDETVILEAQKVLDAEAVQEARMLEIVSLENELKELGDEYDN